MIIPRIDIYQGGPSYAVINLCRALANQGIEVTLFTAEPTGEIPSRTDSKYKTEYFPLSFPKRYSNSNALVKAIFQNKTRYDIIHIHNLWNIITTRSALAAQKLNIPYVITSQGMLSAWQRGFSQFHKELYFKLFDRKIIHRAAFIHFLNEHEAVNSNRLLNGCSQRIIPNGIWPSEFKELKPVEFRERNGLDNKPLVVFLGRLHPIKRLDLQCGAFEILADKFPQLNWLFIGPDYGMAAEITKILTQAKLRDRAFLTGMLSGKDRLSALSAANVYCHTSSHEGHSIAITEALAAGTPCVVTNQCHFDDIETSQAGFIVEPNPKSIANAIEQILTSPDRARTMGDKAKALSTEKYSWDAVGKAMIKEYQSILNNL